MTITLFIVTMYIVIHGIATNYERGIFMKKIIAVLLLLAMVLGLCACGGNSNETKLTLDNYDDYLKVQSSVYGWNAFESSKNYWFGLYSNG